MKQLTFETEEELNAFHGLMDIVLKSQGLPAMNNVQFFLNKIKDVEEKPKAVKNKAA